MRLWLPLLFLFLFALPVHAQSVNASGGYITPITFIAGSDRWLLLYGNMTIINTSSRNQSFTLDPLGFSDPSDAHHLVNLSAPNSNFSYLLITDSNDAFVDNFTSPDLAAFDSNYSLPSGQSTSYLFNDTANYSLFPLYLTSNATLALPTLYLANGSDPQAFQEGLVQIDGHYVFIVPYAPAIGADGRQYDYQFALPYTYSGSNTFNSYALLPPQPPAAVQNQSNATLVPTDQLTNQTQANITINKTDDGGTVRYALQIPNGTAINTPQNYSPGLIFMTATAPLNNLVDVRVPAVLLLGPANTTFSPNITASINYSNLTNGQQVAVGESWAHNRLLIKKCDDLGQNCQLLVPKSVDTSLHLINVSIGSFSMLGIFSPDIVLTSAPSAPSSGSSGGVQYPFPQPLPPPSPASPIVQLYQTPQGAEICIGSTCYLRPLDQAESLQLLTELSCTGSICRFVGINTTEFIQKYNLQPAGTVTVAPGLFASPPALNISAILDALAPGLNARFGTSVTGDQTGVILLALLLGAVMAFLLLIYHPPQTGRKRRGGGYG